ncbi:MAG: glucose-phosphate thymidylyltransferase [Phycisphaerales bacterium]|nr:glucose-phosphate thymidylyltransferase [Phycisphaerales bacterium]
MSVPTERAVILARGLGTRMRRHDADAALDDDQAKVAETGVKALIRIKRPFLDYILSVLADAGVRRVCLVIGPEHHELRRYYGSELRTDRLSIELPFRPNRSARPTLLPLPKRGLRGSRS